MRFSRINNNGAIEHRRAGTGQRALVSFDAWVPLCRRKIRVSVIELEEWNLIEKWSARAIVEVGGFHGPEDIGRFLGVQSFFVEPAIEALLERDLVIENAHGIVPNGGLREAVESSLSRKTREVELALYLDPATGIHHPKERLEGLARCIVDEAKVDTGVSSEDLVRELCQEGGVLESLEVAHIHVASENWLEFPVRVDVAVEESDSSWNWGVVDPTTGNSLHIFRESLDRAGITDACEEALEELATDDPLETSVHDPEKWKPIKDAFSKVANVENLNASMARRRAIELIQHARDEVILFFPWIKARALDGIAQVIQGALDRGVHVLIGFGIAETEAMEESHGEVIDKLRQMRGRKGYPLLVVNWLGGSHTKEMAVDRKDFLHGSHNILSYKPSRDSRQIRRESMLHLKKREDFMIPLKTLRDYFVARDEKCVSGGRSWAEQWQMRLQLGVGPKDLETALEESLEADVPPEAVIAVAMLGLGFQASEEDARISLELIKAWLGRCPVSKIQPECVAIRRRIEKSNCLHQEHRARLLQTMEAFGMNR